MPMILFEFEGGKPSDIPTRYRLVADPACCRSGQANCVIERFEGYDAMGGQRWAPDGSELTPAWRALLNELLYTTITRNGPQPPCTMTSGTMTSGGADSLAHIHAKPR